MIQSILSASVLFLLAFFVGPYAHAQQVSDTDTRLTQQVGLQKLVLDDAAKQKIKDKCLDVQDAVKDVQRRSERQVGFRSEAHTDIHRQVLAIELRLKRQGVETKNIDDAAIKFDQQVATFEEHKKAYFQSLQDTIVVDCQQKPELFQAGLNSARSNREQLRVDANNTSNYVLLLLLPALEQTKDRLAL